MLLSLLMLLKRLSRLTQYLWRIWWNTWDDVWYFRGTNFNTICIERMDLERSRFSSSCCVPQLLHSYISAMVVFPFLSLLFFFSHFLWFSLPSFLKDCYTIQEFKRRINGWFMHLQIVQSFYQRFRVFRLICLCWNIH